jgi:hypothetical protein
MFILAKLFIFFFFFFLLQNQRTGGQNRSSPGRLVPVGGGGGGEGDRRMNVVQTLCTHVVNAKMRPVETAPGIREGG